METIRASVSVVTTRCRSWRGGGEGYQMNKFEQVFTDHHQMSLAGEGECVVSRSDVWGGGGRSLGLMSGEGGPDP